MCRGLGKVERLLALEIAGSLALLKGVQKRAGNARSAGLSDGCREARPFPPSPAERADRKSVAHLLPASLPRPSLCHPNATTGYAGNWPVEKNRRRHCLATILEFAPRVSRRTQSEFQAHPAR